MAIAHHLVATTRGGDRSLLWPERAGWLWSRLRERLPNALSCAFMPDHLHLVTPPDNRLALRSVLTGFTLRFGVRFDIREPEVATTVAIAGRMMRYGFFNAVRGDLCRDPFEWPWSTLRDLVGACQPVWTPASRIARALRVPVGGMLRALTRVARVSAPLTRPAGSVVASIDMIARTVASTLRLTDPPPLRQSHARTLVVQASFAVGRPRVADLAATLRCTPRTIQRDRKASVRGLDAASPPCREIRQRRPDPAVGAALAVAGPDNAPGGARAGVSLGWGRGR